MPMSPPNWSSAALSVLCIRLSTNSVVLNLGCTLESSGGALQIIDAWVPYLPNSYLIG